MVVLNTPNQRGCPQDENWTMDGSNIYLVYKFGGMTEDQVPHCTPFLLRKLMLLALKSVPYTTKLDLLPLGWWPLRNQDVPHLQIEFQKVIPPQEQALCQHWPAFLHQVDPKDDQIRSALLDMVPVLRHWVWSMMPVGVSMSWNNGWCVDWTWSMCSFSCLSCVIKGTDETSKAEKSSIHALYYHVVRFKHVIKESSLSILDSNHWIVQTGVT